MDKQLTPFNSSHHLFGLSAAVSLLWLAGCGGGNDAPAQEVQAIAEIQTASDVHENAGDDESTVPLLNGMGQKRALGIDSGAFEVAVPFNGGPRAHLEGAFGPLFNWPVMPIHVVALPDGRILGYGTDTSGKQGSTMQYAVWDPAIGTGVNAFMTLPNVVGTDIFCGGQTLLPGTGQVLLVGGDASVNGVRNYATKDVNVFDYASNLISAAPTKMAFNRWYATVVTQPNGEQLVLGGRNDKDFAGTASVPATTASYITIPEMRGADGAWRSFATLSNDYAYGAIGSSWFYPRAWVKPDGNTFILAHNGMTFTMDPKGAGTLVKHAAKAPLGRNTLPSVMFAPGRVLSVRENRTAVVVDINATEPVVSGAGSVSASRYWGNATVLADGKVWVSGGSGVTNELVDVAQRSELWDPATNTWKLTASAAQPRLYHSTAILLRDGTVATGGGGAPGPLRLLDAEIFYPPYLFKRDGSGELFTRPRIIKAPTTSLGWDQPFSITITSDAARVTLVRNGAVTHAFNNDTRFFELPVSQSANIVSLRTPANANLAPPGYYMLFVWNRWGVPSIAATLKIG